MSDEQASIPPGRLLRVYNPRERAAIDPFKSEYMKATTPAARKTIAQVHILPALFNHWRSVGKLIPEHEKRGRAEDLLKWLRNVWRSKSKAPVVSGARHRLTDVLWWTRQDDVFATIATLMGLEKADTATPGWFKFRLPASKIILDAMTESEKVILMADVDKMGKVGLPVEIQRKQAEEKWYSKFTREAKGHYADMGLLSISVVAYTAKNGQLVIDIHDEIANIAGMYSKSFEDLYNDKCRDLKRTFLEYIKTMRSARTGQHDEKKQLTMEYDADEFPIAPSPDSWTKLTKRDVEGFYRAYTTRHYQLACRSHARPVPFQELSSNTAKFVSAVYIPKGMILGDPRSMRLENLIRFFEHVASREASHGIQNAFRFKFVLSRRKKGTLMPAQYLVDGLVRDEQPGLEPAPTTGQTKRGKKRIQEVVKAPNQEHLSQAQYTFNTLDGPMMTAMQSNEINIPSPLPAECSTGTEAEPNIAPVAQHSFGIRASPAIIPAFAPPATDPGIHSNPAFAPPATDPGIHSNPAFAPPAIDPGIHSNTELAKKKKRKPTATNTTVTNNSGPVTRQRCNAGNAKLMGLVAGDVGTGRKTSDILAIEESERYGAKGKRRR